MATRMIQRRGTAAEWASANPVLAAGEIGFETDTTKFKFGDGTTAWDSLKYYTSIDDIVDGAPDLLNTLNELAAAIGDDSDFINTIQSDLALKLNLTGGTVSGNLIVQSDFSVGGNLNLSNEPTNPGNATTKNYVDDLVSPVALDVATLQSSVAGAEANIETLITDVSDNANNIAQTAADLSDFQTNLVISDNTDVVLSNIDDNHVLMFNSSTQKFENKAGIPLDENEKIPLAFLSNLQTVLTGDTAVSTSISDLETLLNTEVSTTRSDLETLLNSEISDLETSLIGSATQYVTLGDVETYLGSALFNDVPALTIKSTADWSSDTSTPLNGSLNLETGGSEIKIKVGNGVDTYADLDYVPTNGSVANSIATAIAPLAPKADPTFSGTVSLPSTTSIGDVSDVEIAHLDGVTSGIQGQLDDLDTLKAPIADPTFTGTVSGITKSMVGLSNVDNTADPDKPVSTATQAALDAKASLAGATFTGDVTVEANMLIEGNVTISGTSTTINVTDLAIADPLIYLASDQYTEDVLDVGFLAATGGSGGTEESHLHSGLFRDVSDNKKWKLISNVLHPVSNTVDLTGAVYDTLVVGNIEADGVVFPDGTQTKMGVASLTEFVEKTASYTLDDLDHRDNVVEMNMSTAGTFTVPLDATLAWPVGASMDIFATGTGAITIAGEAGVTLNATPGLTLRTQWSSATILKRGANNWVVYGDLKA
jgi:cytoskeletal protein CcmA (bactofilin family)